MRFVLVKGIGQTKPSWYVDVRDTDELLEWAQKQTLCADGIRDYIRTRGESVGHVATGLASALVMEANAGRIRNATDIATRAYELMVMSKYDRVVKGEHILINPEGGWMPAKGCMVLRSIRSDVFQWPEITTADIRVLSWPHGAHFYAKVGNLDVVVDGAQKWDTAAEARAAAERFIEEGQS